MKRGILGQRRLVFGCRAIVFAAATLACCFCGVRATAQAVSDDIQSTTAITGLPPRDPGYELCYHNDSGPAAFANRWGYHDGWTDGRHNRQFGLSADAKDEDQYKLAPDHGQHPGLDRERYKSLYRIAFLHGYERGSRL